MSVAMAPVNLDIHQPANCYTQPIRQDSIVLQIERDQTHGKNCEVIVRNPDQKIMISGYGHREKDEIMKYGNISDGFRPINGVEYGQADLEKAFGILKMLKDSHIDGVVWSWHSIDDGKPDSQNKDWRDKFLHWWAFDVMENISNPYPGALISTIMEIDSNEKEVSKQAVNGYLDHLQSILEHKNFWRNKKGQSVIMIYAQENEALSGNFNLFSNWGEAAKDHNVEPIFQDFIGSELFNPEFIGNDLLPFISSFEGNNFLDHEKYRTFSYGFPIFDLRPSGLDLRPVNRVTIAYKKLQPIKGNMPEDLKEIPFDVDRLEDNMITAINSGRDIIINSLDEEVENSSLRGRPQAQEAIRRVTPIFSETPNTSAMISSDLYLDAMQRFINDRPPRLNPSDMPPAAPRESSVQGMEARRRKEDELSKPILTPDFKPNSRIT